VGKKFQGEPSQNRRERENRPVILEEDPIGGGGLTFILVRVKWGVRREPCVARQKRREMHYTSNIPDNF